MLLFVFVGIRFSHVFHEQEPSRVLLHLPTNIPDFQKLPEVLLAQLLPVERKLAVAVGLGRDVAPKRAVIEANDRDQDDVARDCGRRDVAPDPVLEQLTRALVHLCALLGAEPWVLGVDVIPVDKVQGLLARLEDVGRDVGHGDVVRHVWTLECGFVIE